MANINKSNMTGIFRLGEVRFGDTIAEGSGSSIVDDTEDVEVGDRGGIKDSTALDVGIPTRDGNDDIRNTSLELPGSDVAYLAEIGANELGEGEGLLLTKVGDLEGEQMRLDQGFSIREVNFEHSPPHQQCH